MGAASVARGSAVKWRALAFWRCALPLSPPVRAYVAILILAVTMPLLGFCAYLVLRSATHEQEVMGHMVQEQTRDAAAGIDRELAALRPRLFRLGSSQYLLHDDLERFQAQAEEMVGQDGLGVVLSDTQGRTILTAGTTASLTVKPDPDALRGVVASGRPNVSDMVRDTDTGRLFIFLNAPVMREGQMAYILSLDVEPLLPRYINDLGLPPNWIITISDQVGHTIARSREAERFVGQFGRPAVLARFHASDQGWFPVISREGIPLYNAFARALSSGWVIAIGIPEAELYAPVWRSTGILLLASVGTVIFAMLLGAAVGHRLSRAIIGLVGYAEAVGRSERVGLPATGVAETDAVARSLHRANEQLQQSALERAVLLNRTVIAQEAERKRIARELHDSLGQYLSALRLGFAPLEPYCAGNEDAQRRLTELKTLGSTLGRELNRIAWELRPMALDDLGLEGAVTQYLEEWSERSGLKIDLEFELGDRRLPQPVETALFRALQESINNVMKHSGADRVGVILRATDREVRLIVDDNGRGFSLPDEADGRELDLQHLGLLGLRERVALVGGDFEVESAVEGGTTVYVRVPL
jgi:signal transduction histidine kinase